MAQLGNTVVRSYSSFAVNDALLAKVVEATKQGERDARRSKSIRSFEVFYHGHRQDLVLGRILIIPPQAADSIDTFPAPLLYGAMIQELSGETVSDVLNYKLGESEYDEYDSADLAAIKDRLFKDADGKYRSIVMFIPTWAAPRDHVTFKFVKNDAELMLKLRHLVFAAHFDPALSSAFNELSTDLSTDKFDVTDITPKLNYPGMAEGSLKQYPTFVDGGDTIKTASAVRRRVILAKNTVKDFHDEVLAPGERAVIDQLSEDLTKHVSREVTEPEDMHKHVASTDDEGAETGLRSQPDYMESDSVSAKTNAAAEAETKTEEAKVAAPKTAGKIGWGLVQDGPNFRWEVTSKGILGTKILAEGVESSREKAGNEIIHVLKEKGVSESKVQNLRIVFAPKVAAARKDVVVLARAGNTLTISEGTLVAKSASGYQETVELQGNRLTWKQPNKFAQEFRRQATLTARLPRVLNSLKRANVPQTLDDIWNNITEDMGPAPQVPLKGESGEFSLATESPIAPSSQSGQPTETSEAHETESFAKSPAKEEDETSAKTAGSIISNDCAAGVHGKCSDSDLQGICQCSCHASKEGSCDYCGKPTSNALGLCDDCEKTLICDKCGKPLGDTSWTEFAPDRFRHEICPEVSVADKRAAFNMFIPGQVTGEFYPELLNEIVDYPESSNSPVINDVGQLSDNGSSAPTNPSPALGIGRDGKPQVLEGAPLRREQDIRGYGFSDEFYSQYEMFDPSGMGAITITAKVTKRADASEYKAQFKEFLQKAMGEVAATFTAAFRVTQRPMMSGVPGTGEIQLQNIEQPMLQSNSFNVPAVASRVSFLLSKLTDSDIQEAINGAYSQAAVWNPEGDGYTYEVFVRPESIDRDTMILKYSFVVGTKGL
jgi:hypothetical protein